MNIEKPPVGWFIPKINQQLFMSMSNWTGRIIKFHTLAIGIEILQNVCNIETDIQTALKTPSQTENI